MNITLWYNFRGHPENFSFMQFSQNIGSRQNDSQGWPLEGAMVQFSGASQKILFYAIFSEYWFSDKTIHRAFRIHTTL